MHGGSAKFSDLYELQEDIGVGSYSICKRCVHRVSAMDYAVKVEHSSTWSRMPAWIKWVRLHSNTIKTLNSDIFGMEGKNSYHI